jgi:tRNA nucleotidyltransferase/poly(A) polymerase
MKIKVSSSLVEFAKLLKNKADLYIVGGYVRNYLLGISDSEVDLSSKLTLDKLKAITKNTPFSVKDVNAELGTALIITKDETWEYSTFRKEVYAPGGAHTPKKATFISDVLQDAKRRDFTINAIYYNINKDELIDVYSGALDLKRYILRTIETPDFVFENDGLRILRMLRLSAELNLKIERQTYLKAKQMVYRLKDISANRKMKELDKILNSCSKYKLSKPSAYIKTLNYFNAMGIWSSFFAGSSRIKYNMVKKASKEYRFIGLLIDLINTVNPDCVSYYLEFVLGKDGLDFSRKQQTELIAIISGYFDALSGLSNKKYFFNYYKYFNQIAEILPKTSKRKFKKYNFYYKYINKFKIPIQVKDIKINGNDLKQHFPDLPQKRYSQVLEEVFNLVYDLKVKNEKNELLKKVEQIVES